MSLVFRAGQPEDVPAFARLAAHSFPALDASLEEWERILTDSPQGGVETHWVGEEEGRLVAACRLLSFRQWIGGSTVPIMGLSTVAISATDRRRGLAAKLTTSAFLESRARGSVATALYPFRTSFYRKLGYGLAGEVQQFVIPPSALPDHPGRARVTLATSAEELSAIFVVYDRWAREQTGQLERSPRSWERVWEGGSRHGALYRDTTGNPAGYVVFKYLADSGRVARSIEIEEIAWLNPEARLALYGWLGSLSDQWQQIIYRAHPDEAFPEHLAEHRYPMHGIPRWHFWFGAAVTLYGPMFRLLDLAAAWNARAVTAGPEVAVALTVHDTQVPANAGTWTLTAEGGSTTISPGAASADLRLDTGIETLSRIYIGALAPSAAFRAGLAEIDRPELLPRLDQLLTLPRPWMYDRF